MLDQYFILLHNVLLYRYTTFYYPLISWWALGLFLFWLSWLMLLWTFMYKFLCGHVFSVLLGIYVEVDLMGHMVNSMFNFLRNCQSVFQRALYQLSHQQWWRVSISPHLCQHLCLFIIAILVGVKWYFTVVLICSTLMANDEHLFMCLLVICISSLEKSPFRSLAHF